MTAAELRRREGYSLIEVLVAFTILAGAIIVGFQIFGDGLRRVSHADSRIATLNQARLILETFVPERPGSFTVPASNGRQLIVSAQLMKSDSSNMPPMRPYLVRISDSAADDAPPLLQTIVFGAAAP